MSFLELISSPDMAGKIFKIISYLFMALLLVAVVFYYFYSNSKTSQVIRVLNKYQHTEFQELTVLENTSAGKRVFMLNGIKNQKK